MIYVIIADDHPITRIGLVRLVNSCHDMSVLDEAETAEVAVEKVKDTQVTPIVIVDLVMPGKGGLWAINKINNVSKKSRVIALSAKTDKSTVLSALKFGAAGFVSKEADTKQILEAVRSVSNGERFISPEISNNIIEDLASDTEGKTPFKLSKREIQTLALAAEGNSLTAIAKKLDLSVKTVSTYKSRIFTKLDLSNNNELIKFALDNHIHSADYFEKPDNSYEKFREDLPPEERERTRLMQKD